MSQTSLATKETRLSLIPNNEENEETLPLQKKRRKPRSKKAKGLNFCFKTAKYSYLCCKCLFECRCFILTVIVLITFFFLFVNTNETARRAVVVWDATRNQKQEDGTVLSELWKIVLRKKEEEKIVEEDKLTISSFLSNLFSG